MLISYVIGIILGWWGYHSWNVVGTKEWYEMKLKKRKNDK